MMFSFWFFCELLKFSVTNVSRPCLIFKLLSARQEMEFRKFNNQGCKNGQGKKKLEIFPFSMSQMGRIQEKMQNKVPGNAVFAKITAIQTCTNPGG
jgi:hypothetical protein